MTAKKRRWAIHKTGDPTGKKNEEKYEEGNCVSILKTNNSNSIEKTEGFKERDLIQLWGHQEEPHIFFFFGILND